jgi:hypothetical protein
MILRNPHVPLVQIRSLYHQKQLQGGVDGDSKRSYRDMGQSGDLATLNPFSRYWQNDNGTGRAENCDQGQEGRRLGFAGGFAAESSYLSAQGSDMFPNDNQRYHDRNCSPTLGDFPSHLEALDMCPD